MDRFAYLIDRQHLFLLIGIILLIFSAMCMLSGDTFEPGKGLADRAEEPRSTIVDRAEEPKRFWENVATWFVLGAFFIGLYLYQRLR